MTTALQLDAQRRCRLWGDHAWITGRLLATGQHPSFGYYRRVEARCTHCGLSTVETHWITVPARLDPRGGDY